MKTLKIEIEKIDRKTMTGSSILKLYPDQHTPLLDLFVREVIQNSLDAVRDDKRYVKVSFNTGEFNALSVCDILDGISENLRKRITNTNTKFISVRDDNTKGLTGPLNIDEVQNYQYGNLIKLVYDICKPQEGQGAGGSWGLGKTIYFRLGIGIVFYYSRIYEESTENYQSRLAGVLIENEKNEETLLPKQEGYSNSGCAWWGEPTVKQRTIPITDEKTISSFLEIFNIEPYKGDETGTEIIIPFIDENTLLKDNRPEEVDDETGTSPQKLNWTSNIDDYLSVACQRWYFPRLNNSEYIYGKYLQVFINGNRLYTKDMLPVFKIGQALYNSAAQGKNIYNEFTEENKICINIEDIRLKSDLVATDCSAGFLAATKISDTMLGMCPPNSCYSPYYYLDLEEEADSNRPIFTFCRKPGMAVSYMDEDTRWVNSVPHTNKDSYIMAIFVLNSKTQLRDRPDLLEEYIRSSEMANHTRWEDFVYGGKNRTIIQKIKKNTARKLGNLYKDQEYSEEETKVISGLGRLMADLILPPEGFGKKSRQSRANTPFPTTKFRRHRDYNYGMIPDSTIYMKNEMEVTYLLKANKRIDTVNLCAFIKSENGLISIKDWESSGLEIPFEIIEAIIRFDKCDGKISTKLYKFDSKETILADNFLSCDWNKSNSNSRYGLHIKFEEEHTFEVSVELKLNIYSRDIQPVIKPE